jgi:hypothetical protein
LFLTSKERLAKQRRPLPPPSSQQQQQTNENRSISGAGYSTNPAAITPLPPMSPRSNASFISSIFGNTNPSCKETKKKNISHDNCSSYQ